MEAENKKEYELAFLLRSEDAASDVVSVLKKHDAEIIKQSSLLRQKLAYPIKKETQAVFGYVTFSLDAGEAASLDRDLRFHPQVLRFLLITPPVAKTKNEQVAQERKTAEISQKAVSTPSHDNASYETKAKRPKKVEKSHFEDLSNEALEKKLEEILK
jgi:ribosomal protein S6